MTLMLQHQILVDDRDDSKWIELLPEAHNERRQVLLSTLTCAAKCYWVSMPLSKLPSPSKHNQFAFTIPSIVQVLAYAPIMPTLVLPLTPSGKCKFLNVRPPFLRFLFTLLRWPVLDSFRRSADALRASSLDRETFPESSDLMLPHTNTGFVIQVSFSFREAVLSKLIPPFIDLKHWKDGPLSSE